MGRSFFLIGEKRKELRSPIAQYNIPEMYDRVSGGSNATSRAAYPAGYGGGARRKYFSRTPICAKMVIGLFLYRL